MRDLINKFFGNRDNGSKNDAKQRLKVLLVHDQLDLSPHQLECMQEEVLAVISKYADIELDRVEFKLNRADGCVNIESTVPVARRTGALAP